MVAAGIAKASNELAVSLFLDVAKELVRAILTEVRGKRELAVELLNASEYDLELRQQYVVHGKTTQGVDRTTVKPGETVSWKGCKCDWILSGTLIMTAFDVKGTDDIIFITNECPWFTSAQAFTDIVDESFLDERNMGLGFWPNRLFHLVFSGSSHQRS